MRNIVFLLVGVFFGILMFKSEAASWFRIYEMFNFQSFHMFGLMGTALATGVILVQIIKRKKVTDIDNKAIVIEDKHKWFTRYLVGGMIFGLGWALAGACSGLIFVLTGAGYLPMLVVWGSVLVETWFYVLLKDKLPH